MHPESQTPSHTTALEWAAALLLAAVLHAALVTGLPRATIPIGAAGDGRSPGARESRIRLALGTAAPPAQPRKGAAGPPAAATIPGPPRSRPPAQATATAPPRPAPSDTQPRPPARPSADAEPAPPVAASEAIDAAAATAREPGIPSGASRPPDAATGSAGVAAASAPVRAPVGAPGADGSGGAADLRARYFDAVHQQVVARLDYPRRARLEQIEGQVVLALRIDRSGRLEDCEVAQSSGSLLLDRHALRIVRRAAPFGPVPASFAETDLVFEQPVDFRLRD